MVRSVALHMTHWPYAFALRDGVFCGLDTSEDLTGLWSELPLGHHIATVLILTMPCVAWEAMAWGFFVMPNMCLRR